ncbi:hypothetical protein ACJMK2_008449 [Sinanodonta woodiana]|uniref:Deoxynucleoside kinase domain-containing protein n=1 Tax=Sinanodonta woodiana TaxID=1069815 RepID=A0ABD3VN82_SINWO
MSFSDQLKCGRCAAAFPEVHIVKCDRVTAGNNQLSIRLSIHVEVKTLEGNTVVSGILQTRLRPEMLGLRERNYDNVQTASRPKPSKKKYTVAVEGNIGCGKSTFLNYFKKAHNVEVFPEPVDKWKDVHGFNTLEKMYNDAQRWSLAFQSFVQLTMVDIHSKESEHGIKLIERSLYSARYCFVENLYRSNLMPEVDYAVLSEFYNWIQENQDMHVDLIVYLQATPKTCQDRIRARNRHEEQSVPIEYLQSLHDLHEDWLIHQKKFKVPCPVLVINTDCDLQEMYKRFDKQKDSILLRNKENIS